MQMGRHKDALFLSLPLEEKVKQHPGNYQAAGEQEQAFAYRTVVLVVGQNACSYHTGDDTHTRQAFRNFFPIARCQLSAAFNCNNNTIVRLSRN
jgi:hypothetical protein